MVLLNGYGSAELVDLALEGCRLQHVDSDARFHGVVAFLDGRRRGAWGI